MHVVAALLEIVEEEKRNIEVEVDRIAYNERIVSEFFDVNLQLDAALP